MVERKKGRIMNIASGRGLSGQPRGAHYAASKAGVIAFTKSLAQELAPYNVLVNAIAPGATDTPMAHGGLSTLEDFCLVERGSPPITTSGFKYLDVFGSLFNLSSGSETHEPKNIVP